jgi:hypothetical protein
VDVPEQPPVTAPEGTVVPVEKAFGMSRTVQAHSARGAKVVGKNDTARLDPCDDFGPVQAFKAQCAAIFKFTKDPAEPKLDVGLLPSELVDKTLTEGGTDRFAAEFLDQYAKNLGLFTSLIQSDKLAISSCPRSIARGGQCWADVAEELHCATLKHLRKQVEILHASRAGLCANDRCRYVKFPGSMWHN